MSEIIRPKCVVHLQHSAHQKETWCVTGAIIFGAGSIQLLRMEWPQGGQEGGSVTNEANIGKGPAMEIIFLGLETVAYALQK